MKKILLALMLLAISSTALAAGQTPNYGLWKPADGEYGWGVMGRDNSDTIDTELKRVDDLASSAAAFDSGTTTGGSITTAADTTKSWGINSLTGMDISIKRAGVTIRTEPITSNTATVITFASGTAVAAADTYQVYASGAASRAPRGNLNFPVTTGTYVLTDPQFDNASFDVNGALVANVTIQIPDGFAQIFVVDNETTGNFAITVKHAATTGVVVPQGKRVILYTTGTIVEDITQSGALEMTRNDVNNGQHRVAQAGTSFPAAAHTAHDVDGWVNNHVGTMVFTIAQSAGSSTGKLSRTVTVTTADAAVAAGDFVSHNMAIEGYDVVKYIGNTFTVGFRAKSAVTGIHGLSLRDGTSTLVKEYTINSANTWEYKSITVVGGLQAVASSTNSAGLYLQWAGMAGTTYQTTADTWNAGFFISTSSQVNDVATNGNVFGLEDVTMNLGTTVAPDTATYAEDLARAQRYFRFNPGGNGTSDITTRVILSLHFPRMRTTPTLALVSGTNAVWDGSAGALRNVTALGTLHDSSPEGVITNLTVSTTTAGVIHFLRAQEFISLDARL